VAPPQARLPRTDDAGQFNVGQHGLCWVHSERLVHKLDAFTDENRTAQATARKGAVVFTVPHPAVASNATYQPSGNARFPLVHACIATRPLVVVQQCAYLS
jgi:hypothetical protein